MEGALHALLEAHYSVDVLAEHQLGPRLAEYPVVVLAGVTKLDGAFREKLREYARGGGSLVLLGCDAAALFAEDLGVRADGPPARTDAVVGSESATAHVAGRWLKVEATSATVEALRHETREPRDPGLPAATVNRVGRGRIAAVYGPVAECFLQTHHHALRGFLGAVMGRVFPEPAVRLDGPPTVDVALRRTRDGRLSVHLINLAGTQRGTRFLSTDHIPPTGPLTVTLRVAQRPQKVEWIPEKTGIKWSWRDGLLTVRVADLAIHGVIVVD
jgi:hypothetical protein